MTLIWFIIWIIANNIGDHERLSTDPANVWTATLILAIALDLGRQHAGELSRSRTRTTHGD